MDKRLAIQSPPNCFAQVHAKPRVVPDLAPMPERSIEDAARPVSLLPGQWQVCSGAGLPDAIGRGAVELQQDGSTRAGQVEAIPLV